MALGGAFLRFGQIGLRILQFLAAAVVLGVFAYFLAVLSDHDLPIDNQWKAVAGMSGAAVLYTIFGIILTLCLGGMAFFGFIAVFLDICFIGCFAAIAYFTRDGTDSCSGDVRTPLGDGPSDSDSAGYGDSGFGFGDTENVTYFPNLGLACRLNTAVFAVSIIAIFLFILSAIVQVLLVRHHRKEKRYGPSPSNNYTKGSGRRPFWKRNRGPKHNRDAEAATALPHNTHDIRPSHETGYTGTTVDNNAYASEPKYGQPGYGQNPQYHNRPTGAQF